ncbi:hypothetical protein ASPVEDRAFT_439103 [Aspergillus versicolor CBS 583.65]|uniref:Uncharacterized protein n=1 Tax=Aspergillus versicolor CBS 583.65 TaxID=1036611 RepID=A0A1L9P8S1_ASPVE|nr:uncharacterized protein ASPVEDRAFT_439103 [Aspergillus versicolor CBS 583.65]OJI97929.1 hypothetical protein ASPVEDRAFT_439103 [Aspergillus versicolor CBS 583.65]
MMAISVEATVGIVAVVLAAVPICIAGIKYWKARHTRGRLQNHILPVYRSGDRLVSRNQETPGVVQALQRQDTCFYNARGKCSSTESRPLLISPESDPIRRNDVLPNYEHNHCASERSSNGPRLR